MSDSAVEQGFAVRIKNLAKKKLGEYRKYQDYNKAYSNEIKKKSDLAFKQEYAKAAEQQARVKAKLMAKQKYFPTKQQKSGGFFSQPMSSGMNSLLYGEGNLKTKIKKKQKNNSTDWIMKL